jgi:hypothetical protein
MSLSPFFLLLAKQSQSSSFHMQSKSHWHAAEHRRGCRKRALHCLSAASLQSPGSIEEHRESRPRRDKCPGGLFFGSFLWASKEMNKLIHMQDLILD